MELILHLAVLGLLAWAILTLVPMPEEIRKIVIVVAVVIVALYALNALAYMPVWR